MYAIISIVTCMSLNNLLDRLVGAAQIVHWYLIDVSNVTIITMLKQMNGYSCPFVLTSIL